MAARYPEALVQIALAELAEAVHQSNAIEDSTLTLEDTERIIAGVLPAAAHGLREVFEASNLARVTTGLRRSAEPMTTAQILRGHGELLTGIDGNGRIGRVLINHQLLQAGLPPIIVRARSRHAERRREQGQASSAGRRILTRSR